MNSRDYFSSQVVLKAVQNAFTHIEKIDRFDSDSLEYKSLDQYEPLYYY